MEPSGGGSQPSSGPGPTRIKIRVKPAASGDQGFASQGVPGSRPPPTSSTAKHHPTAPSSGTQRQDVMAWEDDEGLQQGPGRAGPGTKRMRRTPMVVIDSDDDTGSVQQPANSGMQKSRRGGDEGDGRGGAGKTGGVAARRPTRIRKPTERALGAEELPYDPDDLEAVASDAELASALAAEGEDDGDEEFSGAGNEEEDDMDMEVAGPGRARKRSGAAAAGAVRGRRRGGKPGRPPKDATPLLEEGEGGELAPAAAGQTDFSDLALKPDHTSRPLWAVPSGHIFLETFSPVYKPAQDFLVAIAEPVCRPEFVHEYQLTPHSLYAAVSVGLDTETIVSVLNRLSKVHLDESLKEFIVAATKNYGKVKMVLKRNRFFVETADQAVFDVLDRDPVIAGARVSSEVFIEKALKERAVAGITRVTQAELGPSRAPPLPAAVAATDGAVAAPGFFGGVLGGGSDPSTGQLLGPDDAAADGEDAGGREGGRLSIDDVAEGEDDARVVKSFEVRQDMVEAVKRRCLPGSGGLNYPMLEEYDFRGDRNTPDLNVELKPHVKLRPYQEKSLSKMFGNGRARSGIIVLPCGAGKSLVGVAAAARMRKSCLCLCTSSVSVDQWKHQFMLWTNLQDHQISRFTSDSKEQFAGVAGITITTFTMVAFSGRRSEESEKVMEAIRSREWGLLLMDEVHVVPAQMFRKVISIVHSHCKLGLTATLVREDERIGDLNFLIGPKLYEANWLDLTRAGHIANVQCVEVWCPMTREFFREYLKPENAGRRQLMYCMNPNKFMACQFLIHWHEQERKDKVIVFSDNIWALREYATRLRRPFIYGPTSHAERTRVLHAFKNDPNVNTIFLSKVGDNSLDIPEANVLIQISSHAGSRRQEAQRLGRILRAKRAKAGPVDGDEFNAFFYTLVSQDTQEMYYSTKRQQFLIDQGYAFKVVTNLVDTAAEAMAGQLQFSRREEQLDLLCRVLTAGLDEAGTEVGARDKEEDELAAEVAKRKPGVRRMTGDIRALTGAAGLRYQEYRAAAGPADAFALPALAGASSGRPAGKPKVSEAAKKYQRALGLTKK